MNIVVRNLPRMTAAVVASLLLLSACSSSSPESPAEADADACVSTYTGQCEYTAKQAEAARSKGAAAAPAPVKLPDETIGYINMIDGIESADRISAAVKAAVQSIGWKFIHCDGKGDPSVMNACGSSLLAQGVTGLMLNVGVDVNTIALPLKQAREKNIPVVSISSVPKNPLLSALYAPDEVEAGQQASEYIIERLSEKGAPRSVAIQDFPGTWASDRTGNLRAAVAQADIPIKADLVADNANLVAGTRQQTDATLTQNPKLGAFWFVFDTAGQAGGQAVQARYPGKTFPDRPLVVTFHADKSTAELIRSGAIDMVADVNYDATAWIGVDQLAEHYARGSAFSQDIEPKYPVEYMTYMPVTKENVPAAGRFNAPSEDYVAFFQGKWAAEFGVGEK